MTPIEEMCQSMILDMGVEDLILPTTLVKFFKKGEKIPDSLWKNHPENLTMTSCQATKQASIGDALLLTRKNIGCIAAGISLGLIDQDEEKPLEGSRVYTDIMKENAKTDFTSPTPKEFTTGAVYACQASGKPEFALFGPDDAGRYKDQETARKGIEEMMAIQPAIMEGVFFYTPGFSEYTSPPDVVVMSVRPVDLSRIIQAYQYNTGKRIEASMGGLRVVNSDLIARPYLTQEINVSTFCLGARLIAEFEADRMGIGMPYSKFVEILQGMKDSKTGFPFHLYPGAAE